MRKKRDKKHWVRNRIVIIGSIGLLVFFWWIASLNTYLEPRLQAIAKQNVVFTINSITQAVLADLAYEPSSLIIVDKNQNGEILSIQYESYKLNQILNTALLTIDEFLNTEDIEKDYPDGDEVFFKNGAIYECPIGYLTKIPFLSNVGPRIPIRMKLLNDVSGEIKIDTESYGINNTMIKAMMKINVKTQVITVLSTSEIESTTEIPIILQVVNGKIPSISPYLSSNDGKE